MGECATTSGHVNYVLNMAVGIQTLSRRQIGYRQFINRRRNQTSANIATAKNRRIEATKSAVIAETGKKC